MAGYPIKLKPIGGIKRPKPVKAPGRTMRRVGTAGAKLPKPGPRPMKPSKGY